MQSESYHGYDVCGRPIDELEGRRQRERYAESGERRAESGTIILRDKLVHASGILGHFESGEDAEHAALAWSMRIARAINCSAFGQCAEPGQVDCVFRCA